MISEKEKSKPKQREKNGWVIRDKLKIERNKLGSK